MKQQISEQRRQWQSNASYVLIIFIVSTYLLHLCNCFTISASNDLAFMTIQKRSVVPLTHTRSCIVRTQNLSRPTNKISTQTTIPLHNGIVLQQSSFASDGSEYASGDSDFDPDDDEMDERTAALLNNPNGDNTMVDVDDDENGMAPTIELQPVPLSKNAGNRFVAIIWDRVLQSDTNKDALDLHYDRIQCTEDHVMFCRKQNLYNNTFNTESMVDILWSLPILSSDLQRVIGHAMCLESTALHHVEDALRRDPIIQMLLGHKNHDTGDATTIDHTKIDISSIPLYRWRHIRDYSLRIDDGRDGYPCMCIALDDHSDDDTILSLRRNTQASYLETLIRSERIIAAGPLHVPTITKDDPKSIAVGDFILFNAKHRDDAISFCEDLPTAQAGLYRSMRVHFYNNLDVTGKFVSEDPLRDAPCEQMKEALEYWGYPVGDEQTPWLNR